MEEGHRQRGRWKLTCTNGAEVKEEKRVTLTVRELSHMFNLFIATVANVAKEDNNNR